MILTDAGTFMLDLRSHLASLKSAVAQIGVASGFLYGVFEYEHSKFDQQVKQTLEFYDRFNSSPYVGYRETFSNVRYENIRILSKSAESTEAYNSAIDKILKLEGTKLTTSLDMTFDFFDGLTNCVRSGLCDSVSAKRLFRYRAQEIYENFWPHIENIRTTYKMDKPTCSGNVFNIYAGGLFYVARCIEDKSFLTRLRWKVFSP